jgi:hypothetical protein
MREGKVLAWHELAERPKKPEPLPKRRILTRPKPAPEHPWREEACAVKQ